MVENENLRELGGATRTLESTLDAAGNVLKGAGEIITLKPIKGVTHVAEGVFNVLDFFPSVAADASRVITGPKTGRKGRSQYRYNISRAAGSFKDAEGVGGYVGAGIDVVHALTTRIGTDTVRAVRNTLAA